jgi:NDP-sugar pyrophosphorylase family protein
MYPIAILAGGLATRLRPLTETVPKALLEVNGEPFLAHQLRLLARNGVSRVVICTGHLGHLIEDYAGDGRDFGLRVDYSPDGDRLLGTAGCLKKALPLLGERFLVIYGDSYLPCDFAAAVRSWGASGKLGLMTVYRNEGRWGASNVLFRDGRLIEYNKQRRSPLMRHIDYGLGALDARALDGVLTGTPADLAGLYRDLLERGELHGFEAAERFYEIGSFSGLEELCRHLRGPLSRTA